jgi:protoporphyrinogen/coproporphyrinogen III oxidase
VSIPAPSPFAAVVIGGGISGLACAYRLQQAGIPARVLEAGARPGGLIATKEKEGFQFELGPQSFLSNEALVKLIESLGLKDQLLQADRRAPRYILCGGKLVCAPLSPPSLLTTPLLGPTTKWRIFAEMSRRTIPPEGDESVAAFVRRKFSDELLDKLVAPFVSGVFAGDPEKLSLRAAFPKLHEFEMAYGSVMKGAMKSRPAKGTPRAGLCSFRAGMETLPRALADRLDDMLLTESSVAALHRGKANGKPWFEIEFTRQNHRETIAANAVIVATPTNAAAEILKTLSDQFPAAFARIEYAPVAVVSAGYRIEQIRQPVNGFGFLVPRSEKLRVLGTVWNSSLFPGRAPDGMASFTSFAGGATDPGLLDMSDDEIRETICGEVARVLGISGAPLIARVQRYTRALPQYNLGHSATIATLAGLASSLPGLFLAGNYLSGPSIGSCVEQANQIADAVRVYLASIGAAGVSDVAHA